MYCAYIAAVHDFQFRTVIHKTRVRARMDGFMCTSRILYIHVYCNVHTPGNNRYGPRHVQVARRPILNGRRVYTRRNDETVCVRYFAGRRR